MFQVVFSECVFMVEFQGFFVSVAVVFVIPVGWILCLYICNELRVIWPVPHEILSVITRSTIIT